jgi:hypothetical protein
MLGRGTGFKRSWVGCWGLIALLFTACAGSPKPAAAPPPPPTPPSEPLAWMPEDSTLLAHALIPPFRGTPLWDMWLDLQAKRRQLQFWIDSNLVDELTLGAKGVESPAPSFIAVVKGRFGAGYLEGLAARDQIPGQERGLLRVYTRPEATWAQLSPELIVAASPDRAEWLVTRAALGPATPIKDGALFRGLAERAAFEQAELALLVEDPEGKGKERLEQNTQRLGMGLPDEVMDEIVRAGVSVEMGPNVGLVAVGEAATPQGAEQIKRSVEHALNSLANNMFVGMFGLRPFITALHAETQGFHVSVRGSFPQQDLFALLGKLKSILGMAGSRGAPTSEP